MFEKRRFTSLGLSLLVGGAIGCGEQKQSAGGVDFNSSAAGFEGFDETHFDLLAADCAIDGTTGAMTLTMASGETALVYKRTSDSMLVANARIGGNECAVVATKKINIVSHDLAAVDDQKVIIDFYSGVFGQATAAVTGTSPVPASGPMISIDLGAGTGDTVKIRGTSTPEIYTFGSTGTYPTGTTFANFLINTTTARNMADMSIKGVENIVVSTGPGADVITAQGGAALGTGTQGTVTVGTVLPLDGAISFTAYGGDDNDTITSGATSVPGVHNILSGGAGNDLFPQLATLGSDTIYGGAGTDTVDYSLRTSAIRVTVGATKPVKATGSIALVAPSAIHDLDSITISDGTPTPTTDAGATDGGADGGASVVSTKLVFRKTAGPAKATGSITCVGAALLSDNDYFTLTDGAGNTLIVEYNVSGTGTQARSGAWIDLSGGGTPLDAAGVATATQAAIQSAIDATTLNMTAAVDTSGTVIQLANTDNKEGVAIADHTSHATEGHGLTIVGMTGGGSWVDPADGSIIIDVRLMGSAANVAAAVYSALVAAHSSLGITPTVPTSSTITLTCDSGGTTCNQTIAKVGAFTVSGMASGAAAIAYDDGDVAGNEQDSIQNDVENILGSNKGDLIDASGAGSVVHVLMGMDGDDTLIGGASADYLYGGKGNDTLKGNAGDDYLFGGDGDDIVQGGLGNDHIDGGGVNCITAASTAAPILPFVPSNTVCTSSTAPSGTIGLNTLDYSDRTAPVNVDLTALTSCTASTPVYVGDIASHECDVIVVTGTGTAAVTSVRNIRGGAGADFLTGDALDNTIWGGEGADTIKGGLGNDYLYGEGGNDVINGGPDSPALTSTQTDTDYVSGGPGTNTLNGNLGLNTIDSTEGWGDQVNCGASPDGNIWLTSNTIGENGTNCVF